MGLGDKIDAATDKLAGKAQEVAGKVTGDRETEAEGHKNQVKGDLKDTVENVKDAIGDAVQGDSNK